MKAHQVSLINSVILILFGLWSYFGNEIRPMTAFIPVGFGVMILLMNPGIRKENKIIAHIAVLFTALILLGLIRPLVVQIGKGDPLGIIRVGTMVTATLWAIVSFVQSFIAARKAKSAQINS